MAYIICEPCVNTKDTACVDACPVDCIHPKKDEADFESATMLYINPAECIDCGACEPACPVEAIASDRDEDEDFEPFVADAVEFFQTVLPGRDEPIGSPGGAKSIGPVAADSSYVRAMPITGPASY